MTVAFKSKLTSSNVNNAFISKTADDTKVGVLELDNVSNPNSGDTIENTQRYINEIAEAAGVNGEGDPNSNNYTEENYISDGDSYKDAIDKVDIALQGRQDNIDAVLAIASLNALVLTSDLAITAGGEITQNLTSNRQKAMVGAASAITLSTTPFGLGVFKDGLEVTIIGTDDTNTVTVPNSDIANGTFINDIAVLGEGDSITLVYDLTTDRFYEKGRNF